MHLLQSWHSCFLVLIKLACAMLPPLWSANLLQKSEQSCGRNAVINLTANAHIRTLHAFVLAELARHADCGLQSVALHMAIDKGEIL